MSHFFYSCPWVIPFDHLEAGVMGMVGGSIWHGIKGLRNSPYGERRIGALTAIKAGMPYTVTKFGAWGGVFSVYCCAIKGIRRTEDSWNEIGAIFLTSGSFGALMGVKAAGNSAIMCTAFLGYAEIIRRWLLPLPDTKEYSARLLKIMDDACDA